MQSINVYHALSFVMLELANIRAQLPDMVEAEPTANRLLRLEKAVHGFWLFASDEAHDDNERTIGEARAVAEMPKEINP